MTGRRTAVYDLGQRLSDLVAEEQCAMDLPEDATHPSQVFTNELVREAVERLILAVKASSLADAAVHALRIVPLAEDLQAAAAAGDASAVARTMWHLERLSRSIFDVAARESGIDPASLGADFYMRPTRALWMEETAGDAAAAYLLGNGAAARDAAGAGGPITPPALADAGLAVFDAFRREAAERIVEETTRSTGLTANVVRQVWERIVDLILAAGSPSTR